MATRPFNDEKPTSWDLKGGRHNHLSRHRGMTGLWYLRGTWGQGRYMDGWSLHVFPDSVSVSGYAGRVTSHILTDALMSRCLLHIRGVGGHDFGKSWGSKGGYRPGGSIRYRLYNSAGPEFNPTLLSDGDEFLRQVFGYDPTPDGVREGIARDQARREREAAEKKAADEARAEAWRLEWAARDAARKDVQRQYEAVFDGVEIPEGILHEVTHQGLEVWRETANTAPGDSPRRYDQRTLTSLDAYQQWLEKAKAQAEQDAENAARWAAERAEREAHEAEIAANKTVIKENLEELGDLLSNL